MKPRKILYSCFVVIVTCLATAAWQGSPTKTTITDTVLDHQGNPLNGQVVVTNKTQFTSADGFVIAARARVIAPVVNGVFTIQLVPNAGSTPLGTSYTAEYQLSNNGAWSEQWVVPSSIPPVNLAGVRVNMSPIVVPVLAMSQVTPPPNCTNLFPEWTGTQWTCASGSGINFDDFITPTGTIDGVNQTFNLLHTPSPAPSLILMRNGVVQLAGTDFSLSGSTVTFILGHQPFPGDWLKASDRY